MAITSNNIRPILNSTPDDFLIAKDLVYNKCGFKCTYPEPEDESKEYGACTFKMNGKTVKFRVAKITPKKVGQFVTLWKRNANGPIEPFHISDNIDLFIICTRNKDRLGQFIFPKAILYEKGILSDNNKEGKRAIRVYPLWDIVTSKQAQKTQQWQLACFLEIPTGTSVDLIQAKKLY